MDRPQPEEPEPFSFVFERLVILRAAHKVLGELGFTPDVSELLDCSAWLAGDDIDGTADGVTRSPDDDSEGVPEQDGQGA